MTRGIVLVILMCVCIVAKIVSGNPTTIAYVINSGGLCDNSPPIIAAQLNNKSAPFCNDLSFVFNALSNYAKSFNNSYLSGVQIQLLKNEKNNFNNIATFFVNETYGEFVTPSFDISCLSNNCAVTCTGTDAQYLTAINLNPATSMQLSMSNIAISECGAAISVNYASDSGAFGLSLKNIAISQIAISPLNLTASGSWSFIDGGSNYVLIQNCSFNNGDSSNGAIFIESQNVTIADSTFVKIPGNSVNMQGALTLALFNTASASIKNCNFSQLGGPASAGTFDIYSPEGYNGKQVQVEFINSVFEYSDAGSSNNGGAFSIYAGNTQLQLSVTNCSFVSNKAAYGGAIYISGDDFPMSATISDSYFAYNQASTTGAAIWYGGPFKQSDFTNIIFDLQSSIFTQNNATSTGSYPPGNILTASATTINIDACSFTQNSAYDSIIDLNENNVFGSINGTEVSYNTIYGKTGAVNIAGSTITSSLINFNNGGGLDVHYQDNQLVSSYIWGNTNYALNVASDSDLIADQQNSIYQNNPSGIDIICGTNATVVLAAAVDGCALCNGLQRDICSICNGTSACLASGCQTPYASCTASPTLSNPQSAVQISYASGVNPVLTSVESNQQLVTVNLRSVGSTQEIAQKRATFDLGEIPFLTSAVYTTTAQGSQTKVTFQSILDNGASLSISQTLFGSAQTVNYAGTTFTVGANTLKTTINLAGWPSSDDIIFEFDVQYPNSFKQVNSTTREDIINDITIESQRSITLLSLASVFERTYNGATTINATVTKQQSIDANTVRFSVQFPGPIDALLYDPDIGVLVDKSENGDGGDDNTILVKILVPVLVGCACICVCIIIVVGGIVAVVLRSVRRRNLHSKMMSSDDSSL